MAVGGRTIGREVIKALGLEGRQITRVQLDIPHDGVVTAVITEYIATEQQCLDTLAVFEERLKPAEPTEDES